MPCYSLEGVIPVVHPTAYVHPSAVLIGDVIVGARCYVGPNASLRGDLGRVVLHEGANVQDTCVLHGFPNRETVVEQDGHVGHGAVLHGCVVRRDALIGMNAVVMDEAEIGEGAFVGACAFVPAGMLVPSKSLAVGMPARISRQLTTDELLWKVEGTRTYHQLADRCLRTAVEVVPLRELDTDRPALHTPDTHPLLAVRLAQGRTSTERL